MAKTLEEIIAETNAEIDELKVKLRGDLENENLPAIHNYRTAKNEIDRELKKEEEPVRQWLRLNQGTEGVLYSEKHGIEAKLIDRHGADVYDMDRMPEDLVLLLHKIGALKVDGAVIKASKSEEIRERIKVFARPGPVVQVLEVKEAK